HSHATKSAESTRRSLELFISAISMCPRLYLRDQGTEFEGIYDDLVRRTGSRTHKHTENWPASHGAIERTGLEIQRAIRVMIRVYDMGQNEWPTVLVPVVWIYNQTPHIALGGRTPSTLFPLRSSPPTGLSHIKDL